MERSRRALILWRMATSAGQHSASAQRESSAAPPIQTEALFKRYGATLAVEQLSLSVARGEVYGYLGPNGAGKTTTIRLLLGLHRASSGAARLFGADAWRDAASVHRRVAYVAGEPALWPALTGEETFRFLASVRGGVDLAYRKQLIERFELDTNKRVRALSKGNRQKVALIAALCMRADLLILDEPTSGLDPLMEVAFRECVHEAKALGQTVFLSSHILGEVEALCDRVGILRRGRLVDEGTLAELRHLSSHTVQATFAGPVPSIARLPGVSETGREEHTLSLRVSGEIAPLLAELARHELVGLSCREPSLEEIFLEHYDRHSGR